VAVACLVSLAITAALPAPHGFQGAGKALARPEVWVSMLYLGLLATGRGAGGDAASAELPGVRLELADDEPDRLAVRARALGARVGPDGWLRSPAGQPFTVRGWRGERTPPPAPVRLGRVVLAVRTAGLAAELGFWSSLTGWDTLVTAGGRDHRLLAPAPLPFDLSVRGLGAAGPYPASASPALACDDPAATAALHRRLGAQVGPATCADPTGAPYCLLAGGPQGPAAGRSDQA
jgi:hypothetical protein